MGRNPAPVGNTRTTHGQYFSSGVLNRKLPSFSRSKPRARLHAPFVLPRAPLFPLFRLHSTPTMSSEQPQASYRIEQATSGLSKCIGVCKQLIDKGESRVVASAEYI